MAQKEKRVREIDLCASRQLCLRVSDGSVLFIELRPLEPPQSNSGNGKKTKRASHTQDVVQESSTGVNSFPAEDSLEIFREDYEIPPRKRANVDSRNEIQNNDTYDTRTLLFNILYEKLSKQELRSTCYCLLGACRTHDEISKKAPQRIAEELCSHFERINNLPRLARHLHNTYKDYLDEQMKGRLRSYLNKFDVDNSCFPNQYLDPKRPKDSEESPC